MGSTAVFVCLLALSSLVLVSCRNNTVEQCTLNCGDLSSNDTTSRRDRCAVWYTLARLELKVGVWIQQLPCETYIDQSNETFSEDFITGEHWVEGLDLSGRVLSGSLAPEVADFTQLWDFSCSECNLTGTVPGTWSTWKYVRKLDLSSNNLLGPLPGDWYIEHGEWDWVEPTEMNFSLNPNLNGTVLPFVLEHNAGSVVDINGTALQLPMDWAVLKWYCDSEQTRQHGDYGTETVVLNGTRTLCSSLNFRRQVGWAWVLFVVLCLGSVVAMMLTGTDSHELTFDDFTRGQIEDLEVSYLPLPSSALAGHAALGSRVGLDGDDADMDDHDPLPIGPPRFSKVSMLLLVSLACVQIGLDAPHLSEATTGRGRWVWVVVLVVPHVACATVMHAAMLRTQQGWVKVVAAYFSIPLVMFNMPVTWVLGVLREIINVPQGLCCSALQVCLGIILLPLVLIPVPTILLLLLLMIIGWPEMDYTAFGRNASRVFKQLKSNSYTYTIMLHWTVALGQAPVSALLITFMYAFWFDEETVFSVSRQRWLTAEFLLSLVNMWVHLLVLVRMPNSSSGSLLKRLQRRLQAAQLELEPVLPASHPFIPPDSDQPSNPLLTGEEITSQGVLQPQEVPPRRDGIALLQPGPEAEKEMFLGTDSFSTSPSSQKSRVLRESQVQGREELGATVPNGDGRPMNEIQESRGGNGPFRASSSS